MSIFQYKLKDLENDPVWDIGLDNTILCCHNSNEFYIHDDPGGHDNIIPINIYKLKDVLEYIINNEVEDEPNIK